MTPVTPLAFTAYLLDNSGLNLGAVRPTPFTWDPATGAASIKVLTPKSELRFQVRQPPAPEGEESMSVETPIRSPIDSVSGYNISFSFNYAIVKHQLRTLILAQLRTL